MAKREAIWIVCGLVLGAAAWVILVLAFGMTRFDGRLPILVLVGGAIAYLAAKILRIGKQAT